MDRYQARDVIYAAPSLEADTVAILDGGSLCFVSGECVRSYERMIEFDYEVPGWAVLGYDRYRLWAEVTLDPSDSAGPRGWVPLRPDAYVIEWARELPENWVFFVHTDSIAFYSGPGDSARVERSLVPSAPPRRFNYIMRPLETRGRWLRVELLTPSPLCEWPQPTVVPDTVWIQYLTPRGRPRVFYYTRGC